jgi:tetratricopeptide (TPR) repeat protein
MEFVPLEEMDRIYLDRVHYLGPDKGGERAYRRLAEALEETGRAAVGQYAARGKQYLILIRSREGVLVMEQLHYVDEIRSPAEVPLRKGEIAKGWRRLGFLSRRAASPMSGYTTRDVAKLLGLSPEQVRGYARAWFLTPARGPKGEFRFSFQDLVLLRAAKAGPSARRRAQAARAEEKLSADEWYALGCDLEITSPQEARDAYRRALELDPHHADAHVNLGWLLHEAGRVADAAAHNRLALDADPGHTTAAFDLGIALEDLGRYGEAVSAYQQAIRANPTMADAYYNLAQLYQKLGKRAAALGYWSKYRRLVDS